MLRAIIILEVSYVIPLLPHMPLNMPAKLPQFQTGTKFLERLF